jgi:hypothetical protein
VGLKRLLSDLRHHREALLDHCGDAGGHLGGGVPVVGAHGAAALLAGAAGGLMPHQLIDDPGGDAGVLQPGREGVSKVMGAVEINGLQQRVAGRGQRPPTLLTVLTSAGDQLGRDEFAQATWIVVGQGAFGAFTPRLMGRRELFPCLSVELPSTDDRAARESIGVDFHGSVNVS